MFLPDTRFLKMAIAVMRWPLMWSAVFEQECCQNERCPDQNEREQHQNERYSGQTSESRLR